MPQGSAVHWIETESSWARVASALRDGADACGQLSRSSTGSDALGDGTALAAGAVIGAQVGTAPTAAPHGKGGRQAVLRTATWPRGGRLGRAAANTVAIAVAHGLNSPAPLPSRKFVRVTRCSA